MSESGYLFFLSVLCAVGGVMMVAIPDFLFAFFGFAGAVITFAGGMYVRHKTPRQ